MKALALAAKIYLKISTIKNWKTTVIGCVASISGYLLTVDFNNPLDPKTLILPILGCIYSVVAKDADKTGNVSQ
jgi:FKBP-type peptidyl-prolyl cis-trans isomerase 2